MFCSRCDKPIRPGQKYDTVDKFSPSAGGATLYLHKGGCTKAPFQTSPVSRPEPIREG